MGGVKTGRRIAFVVQRYGEGIAGGSERLCRAVAERLARANECTVLTTCAADYMTWKNEYAAGETELNGVRVKRFAVDEPRNVEKFNRYSEYVLNAATTAEEEERWMKLQGPCSGAMVEYLREHGSKYDAVVFFTYLYATTYYGLPEVKERAVLAPTAHDEPPVYLSIFDRLFEQPRRFLFLTEEERDFVYRRFSLEEEAGEVAGMGLEEPAAGTAMPEGLRNLRGQPYLLYLGRVDLSKGCGKLIEYFLKYCGEHPASTLRLALAGKAEMEIPRHPRIVALGYVSEEEKNGAIGGAMAMAAPSPYESLCIAALEAWRRGVAVIGNGECKVLAGQCQRSGGGLWYRGYEEFAGCLETLEGSAGLREKLGRAGREYVVTRYNWERVEEIYLRNIDRAAAEAAGG